MNKKKIGLWYYSPASVNALYPLSNELRKEGFEIIEYVLSEYASQITGKEIIDIPSDLDSDLDLFIYNTGSGSVIETDIPTKCKDLGIKCISILDTFWEDGKSYKLRFPSTPDKIICVNNTNKKDLIREINVQDKDVLTLGNPHFDRLAKYKNRAVNLPYKETYTVTFLSQCDSGGTYKEPTAPLCKKAVIELKELLDEGIIDKLKIYKHPREVKDFFTAINLEVEPTNEFEDMINADIVISCGSTPEYEANVLGISTITIKKGDNVKNRILNKDYEPTMQFNSTVKSTELISKFIQEYLS